jgi:hypothetical protein
MGKLRMRRNYPVVPMLHGGQQQLLHTCKVYLQVVSQKGHVVSMVTYPLLRPTPTSCRPRDFPRTLGVNNIW